MAISRQSSCLQNAGLATKPPADLTVQLQQRLRIFLRVVPKILHLPTASMAWLMLALSFEFPFMSTPGLGAGDHQRASLPLGMRKRTA